MRILPTLRGGAVLATVIIFLSVTGQDAQGASQGAGRLSVILADRHSIGESSGHIDLVRSFAGLVSVLQSGQRFVYMAMDQSGEALGPATAGEPEFAEFGSQMDASLTSAASDGSADWVSAIAETYDILNRERAPSGSTLYVISGGTLELDPGDTAKHLAPMVSLFRESGWSIVGLALPGASPGVLGLMERISTDTGGETFELSVPDGFKGLADRILREDTKGALTRLNESEVTTSSVLTSTLSVAPGTYQATLLFFKEGLYGSLRLSNPEGLEASAGDRTASSVVETPHVVIWRLIDPVPGQWEVTVRGTEGLVSSWHYAVNSYGLGLVSLGAVPIDQPSTLVGYVLDGQDQVALDGVSLVATITSPNGASQVHELNDAGVSGDALAKDGYFSRTISPLLIEGDYTVELELSWPGIDHRISSEASFHAQAFPAIQVTLARTQDLRPGERAKVASIFVHVLGQPYAIAMDEFIPVLTSNAEEAGALIIKPQQLIEEGRAWLYDVFYTPQEGGLDTLIFQLSLEYSGRKYTYTTDSMVLSSLAPPSMTLPVPVVPSAPAALSPAAPLSPTLPQLDTSGTPWGLLAIPMVAVVALLIATIYWFTRSRPYGYLYDDRDELTVDFANLRRNPIMGLLFRNQVYGRELPVQGLEGVMFKFSQQSIDLRGHRATPTVRVNNQPLVGEATVRDRSWIGAHGKLYSFLMSPPKPQMAPGGGDDA